MFFSNCWELRLVWVALTRARVFALLAKYTHAGTNFSLSFSEAKNIYSHLLFGYPAKHNLDILRIALHHTRCCLQMWFSSCSTSTSCVACAALARDQFRKESAQVRHMFRRKRAWPRVPAGSVSGYVCNQFYIVDLPRKIRILAIPHLY